MWTLMRASMTAAFLAALVFAVGCEDTPITVGKDSTMTLVASPSTVLIDPAQGIDSAQSSIVATILNASGVPQKGITVFFSNSGGVLASGGAGVVTNSGGNALDVLTVRSVDGAEISVSATSAALTKSVKVAKMSVVSSVSPGWKVRVEGLATTVIPKSFPAVSSESSQPVASAWAARNAAIIEFVIIVRIAVLLETALHAVVKNRNSCGRRGMSPSHRFSRRRSPARS